MNVPNAMALPPIVIWHVSLKTTSVNLMVVLEKSEGIREIFRIHHLATMNIWDKFSKWWNISLVMRKFAQNEKSGITQVIWETMDLPNFMEVHLIVEKFHLNTQMST